MLARHRGGADTTEACVRRGSWGGVGLLTVQAFDTDA
jgi:hypothetical protein